VVGLRSCIILKCIELCPVFFNDRVIKYIVVNIDKNSFQQNATILSITFTVRPVSLYNRDNYGENDIRYDHYYRRRILNDLIPHQAFTPTHDTDYYQDLKRHTRAAMMISLSQMKIQKQQSRSMDIRMIIDSNRNASWKLIHDQHQQQIVMILQQRLELLRIIIKASRLLWNRLLII
jgi:hypothetical protein